MKCQHGPPRLSRRAAIASLALAGVGAACRDAPLATPAVDDVAERYVRLSLELAQHQPSLVERWLGPEHWRPGPRRPVAEIRAEAEGLAAQAAELTGAPDQGARIAYLRQQLDGLLVAARRLGGESMRFVDEARAAFGTDVADLVARSSDDTRTEARRELDERLPGKEALHERYATFRARHAIPSECLLPAFRTAVESCRRRVRALVVLPDGEDVQVEQATGLGLQGRADYLGSRRSRVIVDGSGPIDVARLVWVAAHESYPGHHLQHVLADHALVQGRGWQERALHPGFGRHLLCAEGAAEAGAAQLLDGEAFEEVCREVAPTTGTSPDDIAALVAVHRAIVELEPAIVPVACGYLDGEMSTELAAERLATEALVANPQQFLFVIERSRTRLLVYPIGRRLVRARLLAAPAAARWERFAEISTTLTLPEATR